MCVKKIAFGLKLSVIYRFVVVIFNILNQRAIATAFILAEILQVGFGFDYATFYRGCASNGITCNEVTVLPQAGIRHAMTAQQHHPKGKK